MSTFYCSGCESFQDSDEVGHRATNYDAAIIEFCEECFKKDNEND